MKYKNFIYIASNFNNTVLYTVVTNNLKRRMWEHRNSIVSSFTSRYKIKKLLYFEEYQDIKYAILREKQIKAGSRNKKVELIKSINPSFEDLYNKMD